MADDTRQGRDAQWFTEALTTAFDNKAAIPVLDIRSARCQADIRAWTDQMVLLRKREAALWSELQHHQQQGLGTSDARSNPASRAAGGRRSSLNPGPKSGGWAALQDHKASEQALRQLRQQLWTQLSGVKQSVQAARQLAKICKPGDAGNVVRLATAVDQADRALGEVKRQQAAGFRALMEEQAQLEDEVEEAVARLEQQQQEEEVEAQQRAAPGWVGGSAGERAGAGQRRHSGGGGRVGGDRSPPPPSRDAWGSHPSSPEHIARHKGALGVGAGGRGTKAGAKAAGGAGGCLAPEVAEFEEFVLQHGDTGGWPKDDHDEFVRVVQGCGGDYVKAVAVCMENVVGYTRAEVMQHANWHMDCMDLMVRKRAAITKWRQHRDKERAASAAAAALLVSGGDIDDGAARRSQAARQDAAGSREQQVRKQMVAQWREAQEERKRQQEREAAEAALRAQERARIDAEQRRQENLTKLELHRRAKARMDRQAQMAEAMRAAAAEQAAAEAAADAERAARLQQRNEGLLRRRSALVAEKEEAAAARAVAQRRLLSQAGVQVQAAADPSRLLRGTQAHVQRVAARQEGGIEPKDSGFILKISHLAAPAWRPRAGGA